MPDDVKAAISIIVLLLAVALAYWSGSPIRPEYGPFVIGTAIFMVATMWIFPEAGAKKRGRTPSSDT
jgi:hypothetical protein